MKIQLLLEVFDNPSLDGVKVSKDDKSSHYEFTDPAMPDMLYEVSIYVTSVYPLSDAVNELADEMGDPESFKAEVNQYVVDNKLTGISKISLTCRDTSPNEDGNDWWGEENNPYEKTGLGNNYFVYGKLVACCADYVKKNRPALLHFSGDSNDMNLVYDRMIRMSSRLDPQNSYSFFRGSSFMRDDLRSMVNDLGIDNSTHESERAEDLRQTRALKNSQRMMGRQ